MNMNQPESVRRVAPSVPSIRRGAMCVARWGLFSLLVISGVAIVIGVGLSSPAVGRQVTGGPGLNELSGVANKFRNLNKKIRKNEAEISRLYVSMPIGFAEEQKTHIEKIRGLKEATGQLRAQLDQAAMESFQAAPKDDSKAMQHVYALLIKKLDGQGTGQLFDPAGAKKIAKVMLDSGFDATPVLYQAYRASFATQDFKGARKFLRRVEEASEDEGNVSDVSAMRDRVKGAAKRWDRELGFRSQEEASGNLPRVKFTTTEGEIVVELFEDHAPQTVANFISLVEKKFYDGLMFHLVRPAQFAQAGCPVGDGSGDPGYRIANETDRPIRRDFFAGTLGMTHNGPDTAGSQFFFAYQTKQEYSENFVAFGRVVEGLDTIYRLKRADKTAKIPIPGEPSKILSGVVTRKRDHDYQPVRIANPELPNVVPSFDSSGGGIPDVAPDQTPSP